MANNHICPGQISQSYFVRQIYPSLDKYVFKFRNNSSLALDCLDQQDKYVNRSWSDKYAKPGQICLHVQK